MTLPPMSNKWRDFPGHITADAADAEPLSQQLFGPAFDLRHRQGDVSAVDEAKD